MTCTARPTKGSVYILLLPSLSDPRPPDPTRTRLPLALGRERVLVSITLLAQMEAPPERRPLSAYCAKALVWSWRSTFATALGLLPSLAVHYAAWQVKWDICSVRSLERTGEVRGRDDLLVCGWCCWEVVSRRADPRHCCSCAMNCDCGNITYQWRTSPMIPRQC